jgi:deazaflavin-dependent oxidoreductase (nitroreductase family)
MPGAAPSLKGFPVTLMQCGMGNRRHSGKVVMNELELEEMNRGVIADFRAHGGRVGGQHAYLDVLLLHHLGARSGQVRVTPLAYIRDGQDMVIVGSTGGAPRNPAWYWNLKAHPRVTVEVGTETVGVIADEVADDEEYARLWAMVTAAIPVMAEHQGRTTRRLPIIRLTAA